MEPDAAGGRLWTRETRLLLITVGLSLAVLFVLARFRFPDQEPLELPTQPLQRLAARAAFDDLSAAVARAAERVRPAVRVVPLPAPGDARSLSVEDVLWSRPEDSVAPLALAYRFREDAALMVTHARMTSIAPVAGLSVAATDDVRGLAVLAVEDAAADSWQPLSLSSPLAPQYLLLAEATRAGVAVRPLFGGAADPFVDPQWNQPILALGRDVHAPDGAFVFSLEGAFVGAVIDRHGVQAIVPAEVLVRAAEQLKMEGRRATSTIDVRLQRLDPALMSATGARSGALVAQVAPDGPAAPLLAPGDVIVAVAGRAVDSPDTALLEIARHAPGSPLPLAVLRDSERLQITVRPRAVHRPDAGDIAGQFGAVLRPAPGGSLVASVATGGAAAAAGIRPGDVITWLADVPQPAPPRISSSWEALAAGQSMLAGILRDDEPLVIALLKPQKNTGRPAAGSGQTAAGSGP